MLHMPHNPLAEIAADDWDTIIFNDGILMAEEDDNELPMFQ